MRNTSDNHILYWNYSRWLELYSVDEACYFEAKIASLIQTSRGGETVSREAHNLQKWVRLPPPLQRKNGSH